MHTQNAHEDSYGVSELLEAALPLKMSQLCCLKNKNTQNNFLAGHMSKSCSALHIPVFASGLGEAGAD